MYEYVGFSKDNPSMLLLPYFPCRIQVVLIDQVLPWKQAPHYRWQRGGCHMRAHDWAHGHRAGRRTWVGLDFGTVTAREEVPAWVSMGEAEKL